MCAAARSGLNGLPSFAPCALPSPSAALVRSLGIQAYACQPLMANGQLLGTLSFGTRHRGSFAPDELELLQIDTVRELPEPAFAEAGRRAEAANQAEELLRRLPAGRLGLRARITLAFASLCAGMLVHYSVGPYAAFVGLHYLLVHYDIPVVDPEVARAWSQVVASRGQVRVDGLAAEVGRARPPYRQPCERRAGDREAEQVISQILSSRFTLLHATSGAGKTSLLHEFVHGGMTVLISTPYIGRPWVALIAMRSSRSPRRNFHRSSGLSTRS